MTATLCVDEQAARALAQELKDDVLKDSLLGRMRSPRQMAAGPSEWVTAALARSHASNALVRQRVHPSAGRIRRVQGLRVVIVKPVSASAIRAKTHALPKPDDAAGINQKHRKR